MKGEFAQFVKAHYDSVRHLPAKERLAELGKMYKSGKGVQPVHAKKGKKKGVQGAGFISSALDSIGLGLPVEKKGVQGAGFISSALDSIGLGLPVEKKARKQRQKKGVHGAGFLSSIADAVGLGLPMEGGNFQGGQLQNLSMVPPSVAVDRAGSRRGMTGAFSNPHVLEVEKERRYNRKEARDAILEQPDFLEALNRGTMVGGPRTTRGYLEALERQRELAERNTRQGLATAQAPAEGGSLLSGMLSMVGLGLPMRFKDQSIHKKLSMARAKKLHAHIAKTHGAGFADSFLKGLITPFSVVGKLASVIPGVGQVLGPVGQLLPSAVTALTGVKPLI
jgi:hypothetical protein